MRNKYKIAMVAACPFPSSQGSQVLIRQLSEALMSQGHAVFIIVYHFGEHLDISHLNIHRIPKIVHYNKLRAGPSLRKPLLDILLTIKLLQVVKRYDIDIIHAHNYEACIAASCVKILTKTPVIFHNHGTMGEELHTYYENKFLQLIARKSAHVIDRVVPPWADYMITLTSEAKSFFLSLGMPLQRVDHIPPGIYYNVENNGLNNIRDECRFGESPIILYAGNLDRYQNLELLLESYKLVIDEHPEVLLIILTHCNSEKYEQLCKQIGVSDGVIFIKNPSFTQVQSFLQEADVAVVPRVSRSGFPIKLLNYMAAGKAVIVSEGAAKNIEHLKDGFIVKDNDTSAFAEGIKILIRDRALRKMLGNNAKKKIATEYNWKLITDKIIMAYDQVMNSDSKCNCNFNVSKLSG